MIAAALSVPDPFLHEAVAPCTDWSLEILPKHAEAVRDLPDYIREIYVTVIPETPWAEVVAAVRTVHELGRSPIPHITARSIPDKNALEQLLLQFKEFGVERALLIGGGIPEPAGEFTSVLELLQSGLFEQHGLRDLDLAGAGAERALLGRALVPVGAGVTEASHAALGLASAAAVAHAGLALVPALAEGRAADLAGLAAGAAVTEERGAVGVLGAGRAGSAGAGAAADAEAVAADRAALAVEVDRAARGRLQVAAPLGAHLLTAGEGAEPGVALRALLAGGGGDVQVSLTWNTTADLDLWVTDPAGERIYYGNRTSASGGQLDVDDTSGFGPENIFWPTNGAPAGTYTVQVDHYAGASPSAWRVTTVVAGRTQTFTGSVSTGQTDAVTTFTVGSARTARRLPPRFAPPREDAAK